MKNLILLSEHFGVPANKKSVNAEIMKLINSELMDTMTLQKFMEDILEEVGVPEDERKAIASSLDRKKTLDAVIKFRRKHWKLVAERDHLHSMLYRPWWVIAYYRITDYFAYLWRRVF